MRDADKIVVMGSGRKLEEGTHAELVALNGAYATMLQRHHGVVPGDDSICKEEEENMLSNSSAITDYSPPTAHNLQQATDVVPIPHHLPPSTLRQTSEIFRPTSRPGARAGYSFGLQQAEEAQASVDKAEADSKTTARGQWVRFFGYVGEQRRWIIPGVCCSALMCVSTFLPSVDHAESLDQADLFILCPSTAERRFRRQDTSLEPSCTPSPAPSHPRSQSQAPDTRFTSWSSRWRT